LERYVRVIVRWSFETDRVDVFGHAAGTSRLLAGEPLRERPGSPRDQ
jgi:hypothetical protein